MKKAGLSIVIALVLIVVLLYFKLHDTHSTGKISEAIAAIPSDASLIIESNNFDDFVFDLQDKTDFWKNILKFKSLQKLNSSYTGLLKVLQQSQQLRNIISSSNTIVALRQQGSKKVDFIVVVNIPKKSDRRKMQKAVAELLNTYKIQTQKYLFSEKTMIYSFDTRQKIKYYFAYSKGNLLVSSSKILMETSVRQLNTGESLLDNPDFNKVAKVAGENVLANIYINYYYLPDAMVNLLSSKGMYQMNKLKKVADWSVFDYKIAENTSRFVGYSVIDESPNKLLALFNGTEGYKNQIEDFLPQQTVSYLSLNFDSFNQFYQNLAKYTAAEGYAQKLKNDNKKFKKQYGFAPDISFLNIIKNNITTATVLVNEVKGTTAEYLFVEVNSRTETQKLLAQIIKKYIEQHPEAKFKAKKEYIISSDKKTYVYHLPLDYLFNFIFGKNVIDIPSHDYYTFIDDYLIMSDSYKNIRYIIDAYFAGETLDKDPEYKKFRTNLTAKSNITYYLSKPIVTAQKRNLFSGNLQKDITNNIQTASSFDKFAIQYCTEDDLFYTYAIFDYNPKAPIQSKALWQIPLAKEATLKPFIFTNHYTGEKEIFTQDKDNNIYLIDRLGNILWKRKIDDQIQGSVYMIDFYKNGKFQLLFNTKNYIYLIDRNGKDVANYPVKLPAPATASISVFDYEKDKNYRIFVPCENNRVYLLKKTGVKNAQWHVTETIGQVKQPVQHFAYRGKDYLIFADKNHIFILNRRGEVRVPVKTTIAKAPNTKFFFVPKDKNHAIEYFVTTTTSGKLVFINLKGQVKVYPAPGEYTDKHYFMMLDLNGDQKYEFVYAEGNQLTIYNEKLQAINEVTFPENISDEPVVYNFGKNDKKIGIVTKNSKQIFLINNDGTFYQGFPKAGTTNFTIKTVLKDKGLSVLTGKEKYLVNYKL